MKILIGGNKSPQTLGGNPIALSLYVFDVDASVKKAIVEGMEKWDDEIFILGDKCFNDLDKDRDLAVGKN